VDSSYVDRYSIVKSGPVLASLNRLNLESGASIILQNETITKIADSSYLVKSRDLVVKTEGRHISSPFISIINNKKADLSIDKVDNSIKKDQSRLMENSDNKDKSVNNSDNKDKSINNSENKDKQQTNSGNKLKFNFPWWILIVAGVGFVVYRYRKLIFSIV